MQLLILDDKFRTVKDIDRYKSSIWTDRYSAYGEFILTVPLTAELLNAAKQDYFITSDESEYGMIIEYAEISSDVEYGNLLTLKGRSFESILTRRIIWKKTVLDGDFQGQIEKLLNENLIKPEIEARKIENFIFEKSDDERITSLTVSAQFTGDNLYETIKSLCDVHDIGFKVVLNDKNQFIFSLYVGEDRSYKQDKNPHVVFSPNFENIVNSNYIQSLIEYKNVALVAGDDVGTARKTAISGNNDISGISRRELFVDARDLSSDSLTASKYTENLMQRGDEKLAENKTTALFDGKTETTKLYVYKKDFFIGDIVQIENLYSVDFRARITEMITSKESDEEITYPTFSIIEEDEEEA